MMKNLRFILVVLLLILSGIAGFGLSLYNERDALFSAPAMETFHSPATLMRQLEGDPQAGEKIFQTFCAVCHDDSPQIDVDAPRLHDKKAWRLRKEGKKGMLRITLQGAGAMPARGGCFECSDRQIEQAVDYIINNSK